MLLALALVAGWLLAREAGKASGAPHVASLTTSDYHALAFSPADPATLFFGHHGGLLVSRDGGRTWEPTPLQGADAMALAAPPSDPDTLYVAGHDVFVKSTDGGQTWQAVRTNLPGTDLHGFAADPEDAARVYAHVVGAGIFGSHDGGQTWDRLSADVPNTIINLAAGPTSETLYAAAGQTGLMRSEDGGRTWVPLASMPGEGAVALAFDRTGGRLWLSTLGPAAGLYVSEDAGENWRPLDVKGLVLAVAVSPLDPDRVVAVDEAGRVYASRDGGRSWEGR